MNRRKTLAAIALSLLVVARIGAHEITVQGTVAGIEKARIQVKTGKEKPGDKAAWYAIDAKTKIKRGKDTVSYAEARITLAERVVLIIDHSDNGTMVTKEIRLAER